MQATFVSVWDGGQEIRTSCKYNPDSKIVSDIESVEAPGVDILEREYVELADGTTVESDSFIMEE